MTNVWCVRAENGKYTNAFVDGGYVGGGWFNEHEQAAAFASKEGLHSLYDSAHVETQSPFVRGAYVGMAWLFLRDIQPDDYIITPAEHPSQLWYGLVKSSPYFEATPADGCPYKHRRTVFWENPPLNRNDFSVPFQQAMKAAKAAFAISEREEFFNAIGRTDLVPSPARRRDNHAAALTQVLQLSPYDFEELVKHLLAALGAEDTERVGQPGDEGVDVRGVLNVSNLVSVELYVQAKRYKNKSVDASAVKKLRQVIPLNGQGAVVTTSKFSKGALAAATEPGFPRVGLINGGQLIDLLIQHWDKLPEELRALLGLKPGLVTT